jgi:uncharacterized protein (TIGR03790 family)
MVRGMLSRASLAVAFSLAAGVLTLRGAEAGEAVVVIYNSRMPGSRDVAEHYAARRDVPADRVLGLELPVGETMSRAEYRSQLQEPLLDFLERKKLFLYPPAEAAASQSDLKPVAATVRYAVLCYGVPLRIAEDPSLVEPGVDKLPEGLRRNGAAVDSELCTLPVQRPSHPLAGAQPNVLYGATNSQWLDPTNGLLLVARLDGPSAAIVRALVDKAMEAESNGLWGRAYFDLRGLTNGEYKKGDDWIGAAAETTRRFGFETVVDDKPEPFPAAFPMSQIALYAGWYDGNASGPFARPKVEFMPGAFAYHLHSFSAQTLRSTTERWCGPLLAAGATATMGCVDEPFLQGTPNVDLFFARWLPGGFTFGEAAYACQRVLSWQTTVIGDPLYRPFGKSPKSQHEALLRCGSKLIEWSHLRYVDEALVLGATPAEAARYLRNPALPQDSAVLAEKLADLCQADGQYELSIQSLQRALRLDPTPQQKVRLTLTLGDRLAAAAREEDALTLYGDFLKKCPDYPDAVGLYTKMEALAAKLHHPAQAEEYAREIVRLTGGK